MWWNRAVKSIPSLLFNPNIYPPALNTVGIFNTYRTLSTVHSSCSHVNCATSLLWRCKNLSQNLDAGNVRPFTTSLAVMMPAPSKKKRKLDPMIYRKREEKRKKRLLKAMRKMDKKARIPKPLLELEIDPALLDVNEALKRQRPTPQGVLGSNELEDKMEEKAILGKQWNRYAGRRHVAEIGQIDAVIISRQKALEELRAESSELYAEAIKPDHGMLDGDGRLLYQAKGPTATPPIADHLIDGRYADVTRTYAVQYADMKSFMNKLLANPHKKKKKPAEDDAD